MRNATAKPRVVTTPASLPPCLYASGIIVSASMVRIAPAANASVNAIASGEAWRKATYPRSELSPDTRAIQRPHSEDPSCPPATGRQSSGRRDCLGDIRDEDCREVGRADRAAFVDRQSDHERLGDPVEDGAENDRERRLVLLGPVRALAALAAGTVDQEVAAEEYAAAREDPKKGGTVPRGFADRFFDEVERDRAEQDARAESHDEPDRTQPNADLKRNASAENQRGRCKQTPGERSCHRE